MTRNLFGGKIVQPHHDLPTLVPWGTASWGIPKPVPPPKPSLLARIKTMTAMTARRPAIPELETFSPPEQMSPQSFPMGPLLDATVASMVFGQRVLTDHDGYFLYEDGADPWPRSIPRYSYEIAHAWSVIDQMVASGWEAMFRSSSNPRNGIIFFEKIGTRLQGPVLRGSGVMPLMICQAAVGAIFWQRERERQEGL